MKFVRPMQHETILSPRADTVDIRPRAVPRPRRLRAMRQVWPWRVWPGEKPARNRHPVAAWANPSGPLTAKPMTDLGRLQRSGRRLDAFSRLHGAWLLADRPTTAITLEKLRASAAQPARSAGPAPNVTETGCSTATSSWERPSAVYHTIRALAGSILMRMMKGEVKPVMAWGNAPILAQTLRQNTAEGAMKDFVDAASAAERNGLLAATAFGGFQMADIHDAGISVVTVANAGKTAAVSACNAILDIAWAQKEDFIYRGQPLEQSIAQAKRMGEQSGGPILLLDHADNCASGSTQDTMYVLREALQQGLTGIAVAPIRDPDAVAMLQRTNDAIASCSKRQYRVPSASSQLCCRGEAVRLAAEGFPSWTKRSSSVLMSLVKSPMRSILPSISSHRPVA